MAPPDLLPPGLAMGYYLMLLIYVGANDTAKCGAE